MKLPQGSLFILVFLLVVLGFSTHAFAATRTISAVGGNWSSTAAWAEGAVPTAADDVVATGTSGSLTIDAAAVCRSIDLTNYTGTLMHNAFTLSVGDASAGSLKFVPGMTYSTVADSSTINFISTTTGNTVTTAGKLLGRITFNGPGGGWTLQDDLSLRATSTTLHVTTGTFATNGKNVTVGSFYVDYSASAKTLILDNSTITCQNGNQNYAINIGVIGPGSISTIGSTFVVTGSDAIIYANPAAITFNNLIIIGGAVKNHVVRISNSYSPVISGTLTINGNSTTNRVLVYSNVLGGTTSFTAANVAVTNADFRDITGAGLGNWNLSAISGGSGDAGGNTGIIFTPASTQYWKHGGVASDTWSNASNWFFATNGGGGAGRIPLPQDDVVFDANSFAASGKTVQADMPRLGKNINWTGIANNPTWSINNGTSVTLYGSLTLMSSMGITMYNLGFIFEGRGTYTLTSSGKTITVVTIQMYGGTLILQDALKTQYGGAIFTLTLNNGTLDARTNNVNVTTDGFTSSNSNTRSLLRGSGVWTITSSASGGIWNIQIPTGITFDSENNGTIILTDTGANNKSFNGGGLAYNNISITGGGTGTVTFAGSSSFNNFTIGAPKTVTFTSGTTQTITGTFTATGSAGNMITINATTAGSAATLSKASGAITGQYLSLKDSAANGGATWYANNSSINLSGNSGWIFPPRVISAAGGDWNVSTTWVDGVIPGAGDNVIATAGSGNLNITAAAACRSIDLSAYTAILTHNAVSLSVGDAFGGSLNFSGSWNYNTTADTSSITFVSSITGNTVTTGGKLFGNTSFNNIAGGWTLQDNFTSRSTVAVVQLIAGLLDVSGRTVTTGTFRAATPGVRRLISTASTFNLTAGATTVLSLYTPLLTADFTTTTVNLNGYAQTFSGNGYTFLALNLNTSSSSAIGYPMLITGSNTFTNLTINGPPAKRYEVLLAGNQTVTGTLTVNGSSAVNRVLFSSNTLGVPRTVSAGTVVVARADLSGITAAGAGNWDLRLAVDGSGDAGGNSGILFTPAATQYWKHGGLVTDVWSNSFNWFLASGGTGGQGRAPLPQDDAIFDAASFSLAGRTVTADMPRLGKNIDWSAVAYSPSFSLVTNVTIYGSYKLAAAMTASHSWQVYFEGRDPCQLTSAGKVFISSLQVQMIGGSLTLLDDLAATGANSTLSVNNGTFDANSHNVTVGYFSSSNANTRAIVMGSGLWKIQGANAGTSWNLATTTGLAFSAGTSTINLSDTGVNAKTFAGGGLTYNNLTITGGGAGAWTFTGNNTFNNFTIGAPKTVIFTSGTTQTILGSFTAIGSAGNLITLNSSTSGSVATLAMASGRVNSDYLSIQDVSVTGGAVWYAGTNSSYAWGNVGTGWTFTSAPVFYSVGQSASDLKVAATLTIAAGVGTFSAAQTGNIGVGDRVTYGQIDITTFADQGGGVTRITTSGSHGFQQYEYISISNTTNYNGTYQISNVAATTFDIVKVYVAEAGGATKYAASIAQISAKTSQTVWSLITPLGGTPSVRGSAVTVNSITREFLSLSAAVAGATDLKHLNTADLVAVNIVLNIPCYYDSGADTTVVAVSGYTTGPSNYIKIYTPFNTSTEANLSQRHQGKSTGQNYIFNPSGTGSAITVSLAYTRISGLEITDFGGVGFASAGIKINGVKYLTIDNNYIHDEVSGNNGAGIWANAGANVGGLMIYNNLINRTKYGMFIDSWSGVNSYVYNNTVANVSGTGYLHANGQAVLKNNIYSGSGDGFNSAFHASSNYNISSIANDAPSPSYRTNLATAVSFADATNKDFHLSPNDSTAKGAGVNLSADPNFAFSTDIDGQTRTRWDIGADEAATAIYYSVGQNTTDHKTGTPTVDIAGGTATFSVAQTATNMGVGDKVTYNGATVAYISTKISQTQWKLVTATGAVPADVTGPTVNSISHEYASLWSALNGAVDASHLNTSNLYTANYILKIPCYYDSAPDTTNVVLGNFNTTASNYIRIFTPFDTTNEANQSQRHQGKWDDTKYNIISSNSRVLFMNGDIRIDGLQIYNSASSGDFNNGIRFDNGGEVYLTNLIIKGNPANIGTYARGLGINSTKYGIFRVWNNIIYDIKGSSATAFNMASSLPKYYLYNNTVFNSTIGYYQANGGVVYAKNNIANGNTADYSGSFDASSTNNISQDATSPNAALHNRTVTFVDAAGKDFHLSLSDSAAKDAGTDLSTDANFAFNTDIDGQARPAFASWDIGADEATDITPPISAITNPANAAILNIASPCPYTISGSASDNVAISNIQISTDNGVTWNAATCTGCPGASVTWTYSWTLPADAGYTIRSRATDSSANVEAPAAGNTVTVDRTAPIQVTGLVATPGSTSAINLAWTASTDSGTGINGYKVERAPDNSGVAGAYTQIGTSAGISYSDNGPLTSNTIYWYHVRAYDNAGNEGSYSTDLSKVTLSDIPTGANATDGGYSTKISVSWNSGGSQSGYRVYRDGDKDSGTQVYDNTSSSFDDTITGTHTYYVYSKNSEGALSSGYTSNAGYAVTANVYYSVGQNTGDHKTGVPTVTLTGNTATFSIAQTAVNMGVGDVVDYDADNKKCYISGKNSQTVWNCTSVTSGIPAAATNVPVNSISHVFASLSAAIAGASDGSHLNTTDLVTANLLLNIPCYYDTGADTSYVQVNGYITGSTNYIKIYAPFNTSTEVNQSQRHSGKWDAAKYNLTVATTYKYALSILQNYTQVAGLQVKQTTAANGYGGIQAGSAAATYITLVDSCIVTGAGIGTETDTAGIYIGGGGKVRNCIVYDMPKSGIYFGYSGAGLRYVYNCTVYNNGTSGINASGNGGGASIYLKNSIANGNSTDYSGAFDASSTNNISQDATSPNVAYRSKTVSFIDVANNNFHLTNTDTVARDQGVDLSADPNLPFNTDIDGQIRPVGGAWDIGADEAVGSLKINGGIKIGGGVRVKRY